jgi:hypothetical protein
MPQLRARLPRALAPLALLISSTFTCTCSSGPTAQKPSGPPPAVNGADIFPADNAWNTPVDGADQLDAAATAQYLPNMAMSTGLHHDWSSIADGNYGIPYVVVPADQPKVPITITEYPGDSDPGPYPIPLDAPIEGGGDAHVIAVDPANGFLYELFAGKPSGSGWSAGLAAKWDLKSNAGRPKGLGSADAAGLPIFPGLARADEVVVNKEIRHALRFTMNNIQKAYVAPANHLVGAKSDPNLPPMGLRVRLKASVDVSSYGPQSQVILNALKKYGLILADIGADWFITGAPDARWDDDDLQKLSGIKGADFEVVKHTGPIVTQ